MGIGSNFTRNCPKPETLTGIEASGFETAIVKHQSLIFMIFRKQLTVFGTADRIIEHPLNCSFINVEIVEKGIHRGKAPVWES